MEKHLVKNGKKIKGFVFQDPDKKWWYAFGKPSRDNYIAFACKSLEHGIASVELPLQNRIY